jgi:glycosyltransferase involved in cell wall biosynthesis
MKMSVAITAYNHARFLRQAVESVLAQRTDFDTEILLGDDASTDDTPQIIRAYAEKYPKRVQAIFRDRNIGAKRNFADLYERSRGEYFTCLDSDDYWTCPDKLQRQIDFLDRHPDYSICFHSALMVWEGGAREPMVHFPPGRKETYRLEELLAHDFISTSAMVVRHKLIREFPDWFWQSPFSDWSFLALNALHGDIGYLDECWSVYRQHGTGIYSSLPLEERIEKHIQFNRIFLDVFDPKYHRVLRSALNYRLLRLALLHHQAGRRTEARNWGRQYVQESGDRPLKRLRNRAKLALYMRCPALARWISRIRYDTRDTMRASD